MVYDWSADCIVIDCLGRSRISASTFREMMDRSEFLSFYSHDLPRTPISVRFISFHNQNPGIGADPYDRLASGIERTNRTPIQSGSEISQEPWSVRDVDAS